jgi:hypothetical protein
MQDQADIKIKKENTFLSNAQINYCIIIVMEMRVEQLLLFKKILKKIHISIKDEETPYYVISHLQ